MKQSVGIIAILGITYARAAALERREGGCSKTHIVNTRGTGEMQGQSMAFRSCNSQITSKVPGATVYSTMYLAGFDQNSGGGTADIVRYVNQQASSDPSACFVLEGYSQGAMATVNALPKLTSHQDVIKAVILTGNPARGVQKMMAPNIDAWKTKTLDICAQGDVVCVTPTPDGPTGAGHLSYPMSAKTQTEMADFAIKAIQSGSAPSSGAGGGSNCPTQAPPKSSKGGNGAAGKFMAGLKRLAGGFPGMSGLSSIKGLESLGGGKGSDSEAAGSGCSPSTKDSSTQSGAGSSEGGLGGMGGLSGLTGGGSGLSALTGGGGGIPGMTGGGFAGLGGGAGGDKGAGGLSSGGGMGSLSSLMGGGGVGGLGGFGGLGKSKRDAHEAPSTKHMHGALIKRRRQH